MKNEKFDNILKSKAQSEEISFDMDAMWSKVEQEIKPEERKNRFIIWFFSAALIFVFGYSLSSFDKDSGTGNNIENENVYGSSTTILKDEGDIFHNEIAEEVAIEETALARNNLAKEFMNSKELKPRRVDKSSVSMSQMNPSIETSNFETNLIIGNVNSDVDISKHLAAHDDKKPLGSKLEAAQNIQSQIDNITLNSIPLLEGIVSFENVNYQIGIDAELVDKDKPLFKSHGSIEAGGGYYFIKRVLDNNGFNQAEVSRRSLTEEGLESISAHMLYRRQFAINWSWAIGAQYTTTNFLRRDSYSFEGDSIEIQNTLINVEVDEVGRTESFGDIMVGSTIERDVKRYLSYRSVGVPILLGFKYGHRTKLITEAGVEIVLQKMRKGLIYHTKYEYDLKSDNDQIYKKGISANGLISLGLEYKLNESIGLKWSLNGIIPLNNLHNSQYKSIDKHYLFGSQIGIQIQL